MKTIKKQFVNRTFVMFLIIGVINTIASQLFYLFFLQIRLTPGLSSILGDILSVIVSYYLNITFTYKIKSSWKLFFTFPLSYIPGWIVNYLIVILTIFLGIPEIYAKAVSLPITIPLNYFVMNWIIKKRGKN